MGIYTSLWRQPGLVLPDGNHLNVEGNRRLAAILARMLQLQATLRKRWVTAALGASDNRALAGIVSHQVLSEPYFVDLAERRQWQLGNYVNMLRSVNRSSYRFDVCNDRFL
jgi:hypothetical protein